MANDFYVLNATYKFTNRKHIAHVAYPYRMGATYWQGARIQMKLRNKSQG